MGICRHVCILTGRKRQNPLVSNMVSQVVIVRGGGELFVYPRSQPFVCSRGFLKKKKKVAAPYFHMAVLPAVRSGLEVKKGEKQHPLR